MYGKYLEHTHNPYMHFLRSLVLYNIILEFRVKYFLINFIKVYKYNKKMWVLLEYIKKNKTPN